jgi:hypothetical protein
MSHDYSCGQIFFKVFLCLIKFHAMTWGNIGIVPCIHASCALTLGQDLLVPIWIRGWMAFRASLDKSDKGRNLSRSQELYSCCPFHTQSLY